jgi:gliding motility-associated-like protein
VFVKDGLHIPNSFTPNGDGINDKWRVPLLNSLVKARINVYDRTGKTVFTSNGYDLEWDGTYNNKPLPIDTYYYIIEPNNGMPILKGWIQLIR